jgi:DNA-binding MarR family transcriptional regulator
VPPKTETAPRPKDDTNVQAREVLTLLTTVVGGLKQRSKDRAKPEAMEKAFESGELGERHVSPLLVLTTEGPLSVGELAGRLGLTLGTTSLLVGELSRAGLVERREDEADRRRTIVSIAEEHAKVMRPVIDETLAPLSRALGRMKPAQRGAFIHSLAIVAEETGASGEVC